MSKVIRLFPILVPACILACSSAPDTQPTDLIELEFPSIARCRASAVLSMPG